METKNIMRWILVPIIAFVATYLMLFVALKIMPSLVYPYNKPVFGSIAAFTFVASGAIVAPGKKVQVALALFVLGAIISWPVLSNTTEPDSVTPTYVPMLFTYISGVFGVLVVYLMYKKHNKYS